MSNFGSPLQQIIDDLDNSSNSMYYCFNSRNARYAIKAIDVWEIHSVKGLFLNKKNELCLFLRGKKLPVTQIDGITGFGDVAEGNKIFSSALRILRVILTQRRATVTLGWLSMEPRTKSRKINMRY